MKLETITMVDTCEFERWAMEKYGMDSQEWHEKIWRAELCGRFEKTWAAFTKYKEPATLLQEHINAFLDDFPELGGIVRFVFTN